MQMLTGDGAHGTQDPIPDPDLRLVGWATIRHRTPRGLRSHRNPQRPKRGCLVSKASTTPRRRRFPAANPVPCRLMDRPRVHSPITPPRTFDPP